MGTRVVSLVVLVLGVFLSASGATALEPGAARSERAGRLQLIWGDPEPGSGRPSISEAWLVDDDGQGTKLSLSADAHAGSAELSGRRVVVSGTREGSHGLRVTSLRAADGPVPRAVGGQEPVVGTQRWAAVLCAFADIPDRPAPPEWFHTLLGSGEPNLKHYWQEVSYGQLDLAAPTVVGWFTLPHPRSYYFPNDGYNMSEMTDDCVAQADAQLNFPDYDGISLAFNGELDGFARGGSWYFELDGESRQYGITWLPPFGYQHQYIYAHEMGHAFGLPHSSGPYNEIYDSMWDVMSLGGTCNPPGDAYGCIGVHPIAYHKDYLGWLPDERIFVATSGQQQTIHLERLALPGEAGYLLARVPIQGSTTRYYTIEARQYVGYDIRIPREAVVIHSVDERFWEQSARVVDPDGNLDPNDDAAQWLPGETFNDAANHISITVESASESGFDVTIRAGDAYIATWERTDKPVADLEVGRTWMWGPESFSGILDERYYDAPSGWRQVQYFDKSRMEINDPSGDPTSIWYVTNGLLVVELTTGRLQLGDSAFEQRDPADVNVAGDGDDPSGPTYATFGLLRYEPALEDEAHVIQRVSRDGTVTEEPGLAARGVTAAHRVTVPDIDHQVASPFWQFMNSSGLVYQNGDFTNAPLFIDPFYATGYPISEAYWATVKVAGVNRDVLIQCFERRCLTYTPDNPAGWQVEAGNVGRHYFDWRYAVPAFPGRIAYSSTRGGDSDIWVMDASDHLNPRNLTDHPAFEAYPDWSPDGERLAFVSSRNGDYDLYTIAADGSDVQQLTFGLNVVDLDWSPDGLRILFSAGTGQNTDIYAIDTDGSDLVPIIVSPARDVQPDWSPDGESIAFVSNRDGAPSIYIATSNGTNPTRLTFDGPDHNPAWSPDGTQIAFERQSTFVDTDIVAMDADGSNEITITTDAAYETEPAWSPDGTRIAYVTSRYGIGDIAIADADGDNEYVLTIGPYFNAGPSWAAGTP